MNRVWLLAASLACQAGCAQVLSLDDYRPAPDDAGDDATQDTTTSEVGADVPMVDRTAVDGGSAGDATVNSADAWDGSDASAAEAPPEGDASNPVDGSDAGAESDAANAPDANDGADASDATTPDGSCAGTSICAAAPPAGWAGPLALWEGPSNPPGCGSGFHPLFDGGVSPSASSAQCTCACEAPNGVGCGPVTLTFNRNCSAQNCGGTLSLSAGACTNVGPFDMACKNMPIGVTVSGSTALGGSCAPDASTGRPPWTWGTAAVACAPSSSSSDGCAGGQLCVPVPRTPFESRLCILQQGNVACPSGGYSVPHVYYGGALDTRACSTCNCGSPAGSDCNANAHVQIWDSCGSGGHVLMPGGDLHPLPAACAAQGSAMQGASFATTPSGGSCVPDGGQAVGTVTAQNPFTICCMP